MTLKQVEKYESKRNLNVSLLNLTVYAKFVRKGWLVSLLPGLVMVGLGIMMASIWPEFESVLKSSGFVELLESPFYQAFISQSLNLTTFEGFWAIELFTILDFLIMFLVVFIPVRIITSEVDKNTLDIVLSYPIPRWHFVTQRFLVYITQMAFLSLFIFISAFLSATIAGESFNYENLTLSVIAIFFTLFSLGALSLLAGAFFLESGKALPVSGIFIIGMWIMNFLGGLVESLNYLKDISVFNYLDPGDILGKGVLPLDELLIVFLMGLLALLASLFVFQRRELAY